MSFNKEKFFLFIYDWGILKEKYSAAKVAAMIISDEISGNNKSNKENFKDKYIEEGKKVKTDHAKTIDTIGLDLTMSKNAEMNLEIKCTFTFRNFFRYLSQFPHKENKESVEFLSRIIQGHLKIIIEQRDLKEEFRTYELLCDAIPCLKSFGVQTEKLEKYNQHLKNGTLKEYIMIENYLTPIGEGFSPSTYQLDSTQKYYHARWAEIIQILHTMDENKNAKELMEQSLDHLKKSIQYAILNPPKFIFETKREEYEYEKIKETQCQIVEILNNF